MRQGFYFITGTKRSATHYLNRLFDGHPELGNTIIESYIFEYYLRNGQHFEKQFIHWIKTAPIIDVYQNILSRQLLPAFKERNIYDNAFREESVFETDFDYNCFCRLLEKERKNISSTKDLIRIWMDLLGEIVPFVKLTNRKNWIFKSADFGKTLLGANKLGLLDRAVFLVRNPLGIVNSIKKRRELEVHREFHVFELFEICSALESIIEVLRTIEGKYLLVHYEDLVRNHKKVLESICDFWGVCWNNCLKSATLIGAPWQINTSFVNEKKRRDILVNWEKIIVKNHTKRYQQSFAYDL